MEENSVLVLGSKPNSDLPNISVKKIYTANGTAERGRIFKKKFSNIPLTSIVGLREFQKNHLVKDYIINAKPNRVIFRTGDLGNQSYFENNCKVESLSWRNQWDLQKKYFRFSPFSLILGELSRNTKYSEKIIYLFNCLRKMNFIQ